MTRGLAGALGGVDMAATHHHLQLFEEYPPGQPPPPAGPPPCAGNDSSNLAEIVQSIASDPLLYHNVASQPECARLGKWDAAFEMMAAAQAPGFGSEHQARDEFTAALQAGPG